MKTIHIIAIAASLGFLGAQARADHHLGSPKAREFHARALTSTGTDVRQKFEYRGGKAAFAGNTTVAKKEGERDLVREQRNVVYTGKNPLRDLQKPFEVAPVK